MWKHVLDNSVWEGGRHGGTLLGESYWGEEQMVWKKNAHFTTQARAGTHSHYQLVLPAPLVISSQQTQEKPDRNGGNEPAEFSMKILCNSSEHLLTPAFTSGLVQCRFAGFFSLFFQTFKVFYLLKKRLPN